MPEHRKKLIEVALPLDAINTACKVDKDRKTGTIRNLHKWFAPMPAPAWRALLFASLVDAPTDKAEQARLLRLIENLVSDNGSLRRRALTEARQEIGRSMGNAAAPMTIFEVVTHSFFCGLPTATSALASSTAEWEGRSRRAST